MYTILLAEDEDLIRSNVVLQINSGLPGYKVTMEAASGNEAIELLQEEEPDIMITDIRMPGADGLQVIREAKALYPNMPCIVLTGFQEFEIAKEALALGTIDYILKPVKPNELIEALQKAAQQIKKTNQYDSLYPLIELEPFFIQALEGDQEDQQIFASKAESYMPLAASREARVVLAIDNFVMRQQLFEVLSELSGIVFCTRYMAFAAIVTVPKQWGEQQLLKEIRQIAFLLGAEQVNSANTGPAIGMSRPFDSWEDAPQRYEEAFDCFAQRFYSRGSRVAEVYYYGSSGIAATKNAQTRLIAEEQARNEADRIEFSIQSGSWNKLEEGVTNWFAKARVEKWPSLIVHQECARILRKFLYAFTDDQLELLELANWSAMQWVIKKRTIDELERDTVAFLQDIKRKTEHYSGSMQSIVAKVQAIIARDYGDSELSIVHIAEQLYISASHLSMIFKKKTGIPFSQYVKELRLDNAKRLIEEDRLKIYEIAAAVGYLNEKSFSRAFRRELGESPQNYKRKSGLL